MQKRLITFLFSLVPFCAVAEQIIPGTSGVVTPFPFGNNLNAVDETYVFNGGAGFSVIGTMNSANAFYVGYDVPLSISDGYIYADGTINRNRYRVTAGGTISIGTSLNVNEGYNLTIGGADTNPNIYFSAGAINAYGGLSINNVGAISTHQINAYRNGNLNINGFSLTVTASAENTGNIQAIAASSVTIDLTGNLTVAGSIANQTMSGEGAAGNMTINAANVTAATMVNDVFGNMNLSLKSLNLTGGDSENASFVNSGNFSAVVTNATTLAYGFDLSTMEEDNTFSLTTGTLSLGARVDEFYNNNLDSFSVYATNVTNGNLGDSSVTIYNGVTNANASMQLHAGNNISALSVINNASMGLIADTIDISSSIINSAGNMNIEATTISVPTVTVNGGLMNVTGAFDGLNNLYALGNLYQNGSGTDGAINFTESNYTLTAGEIDVGGIIQNSRANSFLMYTDDLHVHSNGISAHNFTIRNIDATGTQISVTGNVSDGVGLIGLESMLVDGNYTFGNGSRLLAVINPESDGYAYWGTSSFDTDVFGTFNFEASAEPLISISGQLINDISIPAIHLSGGTLLGSQIGIVLQDTVYEDTAIWLMHADGGITEAFARLNISLCNADGSECFNYLGPDGTIQLPWAMRLITRGDNVYIVFDERFKNSGGLYKLQPVVAKTSHSKGEYESAGALDDVIEALLYKHGYTYDSPISVLDEIFVGTPLVNISDKLRDRMIDYLDNDDPKVIRNFSRLFQLNEANQIADNLALNTYAEFRDMADMFIDEAIWNRHRRLNKLWARGDFSWFTNSFNKNKADGTRLNLSFGYDWQHSKTWILGFIGHASYIDNNNTDVINLGFGGTNHDIGHVETDVTNLNVGAGLYFLKILNNKLRLYGDVIADINWIDMKRTQTWVDEISGDTQSFGILSEFGLIHDWLNQYIIGNLYARFGYNFGFDLHEKVPDDDYMELKFDGHPVLIPGYSLTAQKRVYPSVWFEFRPYATVGVEYALFGTPDTLTYKFSDANAWRPYTIGIDPLWFNAGGGVEFLSVHGWHVGVGYSYLYNADLDMHKINLSAKFRF